MNKLAIATLTIVALAVLTIPAAFAANTENDYTGSVTGSVLTGTNWSGGHAPLVSEDAVFNNGTGIRTFNNSSLTVGSWNVTATGTYTIRNATAATTSTLTLGGAGNLGNSISGDAADLLFATSGTFTIAGVNGTALISVVLGQSGNFDAASTINVNAVVSDGGNGFAVTKTGAGTLTLSGANTFSGGTTLSAGTLKVNNNGALGTGTFTVNGGTITNDSGSDVTANNATVLGGNVTAAVGVGTNNINLAGSVTLTGNRSINVSGATSTLTISGVISGGFSLTKSGPGVGTLNLSGTNTYSGGTNIGSGTLAANKDGALGSGDVSLTAGSVTLTLQNGVLNNYIANSASLSLFNSTDHVNLNYTGSDTVSQLIINNVSQAAGTYGAVGSGAQFELSELMGTGTLTVIGIPEPATWMLMGIGLLIGVQRLRRKA